MPAVAPPAFMDRPVFCEVLVFVFVSNPVRVPPESLLHFKFDVTLYPMKVLGDIKFGDSIGANAMLVIRPTRVWRKKYIIAFSRSKACESPENRRSSPTIDTRNPREVSNALSVSRLGIRYLKEGVGGS
ncbi:hypothetical protein EVAR_97744_1 [Eumeta japonica]|uniref:Uncharacterized protein n=1 Tax=Eumeta variegata TaxID=151549 RepID=A0A4C1X8L7_EUMVA|nr:hypothetical protein EVAR_97744_1 [Eumeta japonica]